MAVYQKGSPITGLVIVEARTQLNAPVWALSKQQQCGAIITCSLLWAASWGVICSLRFSVSPGMSAGNTPQAQPVPASPGLNLIAVMNLESAG